MQLGSRNVELLECRCLIPDLRVSRFGFLKDGLLVRIRGDIIAIVFAYGIEILNDEIAACSSASVLIDIAHSERSDQTKPCPLTFLPCAR